MRGSQRLFVGQYCSCRKGKGSGEHKVVPAPRDRNEPVAFICDFQFLSTNSIQATGN